MGVNPLPFASSSLLALETWACCLHLLPTCRRSCIQPLLSRYSCYVVPPAFLTGLACSSLLYVLHLGDLPYLILPLVPMLLSMALWRCPLYMCLTMASQRCTCLSSDSLCTRMLHYPITRPIISLLLLNVATCSDRIPSRALQPRS